MTEKYIDDVNCVNNEVSLDKFEVNLPVNAMLLKSIDNMQISTHDGFLLIEADPKQVSETKQIMNFKNTDMDRIDDEIYYSQMDDDSNSENEYTVQMDTLKDLFGNINDNIMNVYQITKKNIKKSIVKRIYDTSKEEKVSMGKKTMRNIKDGIKYI